MLCYLGCAKQSQPMFVMKRSQKILVIIWLVSGSFLCPASDTRPQYQHPWIRGLKLLLVDTNFSVNISI